MEFYQKLQKLRRESGMSQEELAEHLGVSRQAVSKWENGQGFPETDKLVQISTLFNTSLDYLLKEDGPPDDTGNREPGLYVNRETVDGFLQFKRQGALRVALGVAVIILALVPPILLQNSAGAVLMFLMAGIGVAVLVSSSFRGGRYEQLSTQPLLFDAAFLKEFRARYYTQRKKYGTVIAGGILVIFLGLVAVVLSDLLFGQPWEDSSGALLFLFAAAGVAMIVYASICLGAQKLIAENEQHVAAEKDSRHYGWVYGVLMPLAVIAFFVIGFVTGGWQYAWIPFPIAALLGSAISVLLRQWGKKG